MPGNTAPGGRPVIGLSTYSERARYGVWDHEAVLLPRDYADLVERAGGIPVLLPPVGSATAELVARLDGVVLTGGADLDPGRYGAAPHPTVRQIRPGRDEFEFTLFERARAAELPVLAICRGMQLVNVALGGTLLQHLPDVLGHDEHCRVPGVFTPTRVRTAPGSRLAAIVGPRVLAHCHHHQAIDRLAPGLTVSARAEDGIIEAAESDTGPFLVGVQWHPEADATEHRLMRALVDAAVMNRREHR
ncbi:gamma-glutamyl-gamma-aminobutyrate hydrolase family protein [Nocardia otitidiscaviarum]|uniref:gamma-glutamyl-gamma-aminobutyrate hydrolase family protein n=1 Tax=Nocardia otitidiscaviarum TaxID=1823 RepID=UPI0004A77FE0|nr:gamma-glutamyl-gamma-aminobutyrate hydrolase family protein [Nocardia otitidiscaviarum]